MATIQLMKNDELNKVANFLAELNKMEENHIGYCGTDAIEIAETLKEEIPYTKTFLTAYENDELIGLIGFDPDVESGTGEIWGPFLTSDTWQLIDDLWEKLLEILPKELRVVYLFPNSQNRLVREFAAKENFIKKGKEVILEFQKSSRHRLKDTYLEELTPVYYDAFIQLHDTTFPGTYYNGDEIVQRLDETYKVFITKENSNLCGYIYVEAEPKYGEASIEFFGVSVSERGKGIGLKLLTGALKWIFSFDTIESITLCVNADNKKAIRLYEKVGFNRQHDMCFFKKEIK